LIDLSVVQNSTTHEEKLKRECNCCNSKAGSESDWVFWCLGGLGGKKLAVLLQSENTILTMNTLEATKFAQLPRPSCMAVPKLWKALPLRFAVRVPIYNGI